MAGFPMNEAELRQAVEHDNARRVAEPIPLTQRMPDGTAAWANGEIQKLREQRRAQFAAQAHAAMIMSAGYNADPVRTANIAVQHADALLAELEKRR